MKRCTLTHIPLYDFMTICRSRFDGMPTVEMDVMSAELPLFDQKASTIGHA